MPINIQEFTYAHILLKLLYFGHCVDMGLGTEGKNDTGELISDEVVDEKDSTKECEETKM